jgi:phage-related protein
MKLTAKPPVSPKSLFWIGSSREDLKEFPKNVRVIIGQALYTAQHGEKHIHAKPLKGFKGAGVLEVVEHFDRDTYRAVYTVKFSDRVYVLHAFQKKAKKGIATPKAEIDLVEARLKWAEREHEEWIKAGKETKKK